MKKRYVVLIVFAVLAVGVGGFLYWWTGGSAQHAKVTPARYQVEKRSDLAYVDSPDISPKQRLDLFLPFGLKNAPVAAIWHGGGWTEGDRSLPAVQQLAYWLAERGVIGAAMGYRLAGPINVLEQARDAARGATWLYAHAAEYGGDPARIYFVGHSAGAQLAALVACDRKYLDELGAPATVPAGVVALAAPYDLRGDRIGSHPLAKKMIGGVFGNDREQRGAASPIAFVHPGLPPFLLIVGRGDHLLPRAQSREMAAALRAVKVNVEVLVVPGRAHIDLFQDMTDPGDLAGEATLRFVETPRR